MIIGTLAKQPAEVLRITVDFGSKFLATGETVTAMTATTSPTTSPALTALVLSGYPVTSAVVSIGGGASGESYLVTLRATTSFGQIVESEVAVACEEISV